VANHFEVLYINQKDRIPQLCLQLLSAPDDETLDRIIPELRAAIPEHCENLRRIIAIEHPFKKEDIAG